MEIIKIKKIIILLVIISLTVLITLLILGENTNISKEKIEANNMQNNKSDEDIFAENFEKWAKEYLQKNNNKMPEIFQYGDYEYAYNKNWFASKWSLNSNQNGWGVRVIDKTKDTYGLILNEAFGKPVTSMLRTFDGCALLKSLPDNFTIPQNVTDMMMTFSGCTSLKSLPDSFTIPQNLIYMQLTFNACTSLESLPVGFKIPQNLTDMWWTFNGCSSLTSLPDGFEIPDSVTDLVCTFNGCSSLRSLPANFAIPQNVKSLTGLFGGCKELEGTIIINSNNANSYIDCFKGTTKDITLTTTKNVSRDVLELIAATSANKNIKIIN